jgi:drug/metabolite transporter (DMT)-like permease
MVKDKSAWKWILFMQGAVIVYSFCGVFQKMAANQSMLSWRFIVYYGCSIGILFIYAVLWQIILRKLPLTTAYSNRAISMIWSMVWSVLLFQETIRWNQVLGAIVICFGVYKVVTAEDG